MRVEIINDRPAIINEETGVPVYSDLYVGARYGGRLYSTAFSYEGQKWSVKEAQAFEDFNADGLDNLSYYIAECEDSKIFIVLGDDIYARTEYYNKEAKWIAPIYDMPYIALGGMWNTCLDRVLYNEFRGTNGILTFEMQSDSGVKILSDMEAVESATHGACTDVSGVSFDCGFITFDKYFSGVNFRQDGKIEFQLKFDSSVIPENKTIKSDWMRIGVSDNIQYAQKDYAYAVRDFNNIKLRFDHAPTGFCTWYYYLGNISERTVFENMEALDKIRDKVPLEVFQIDDGWGSSHNTGDMNRFPKGMKYYADYIKEHGMTPGIWLTPFNFGTWESIVTEHPEWFVHQGEELKIVNGCAIIDATHPGAQEYIKELYKKITYDWGYRYLKLDHVTLYLCGGDFYDKEAGALQNLRAYYKTMREACHPDTYILACTSPMIEVAEYIDGARTSGDIFECWNSLHGVFRRNFDRWYMNGVLFWNDPDCIMLRTASEEDEDCQRLCSRTHEENRTFATAMYTTGGTLMISDKLPLATDKMVDDYAKFFPHSCIAGIPLDQQDSFMPSIFDLGETDGVFTASFINWSDREKDFTITFGGTVEAVEHWDDTPLGTFTDEYTVTLKPHHSQLVHFKRV